MPEDADAPKYSLEQIQRLLGELPSKLEKLLEKCVGKEPLLLDSTTFDMEANELVTPFLLYADEIYHTTGNYPEIARSAMEVFAAKKAEYEAQIMELDMPSIAGGTRVAIDAFLRLKLLFHFFGYTEESYPGNMLQWFDLDYQLENERNPERRRELLKSISEITKDSSTGFCSLALMALEEGNYQNALEFCRQAIEKFPGNTQARTLQLDILQAMEAKIIEEGLEQEPRDQALRVARDIETRMRQLRDDIEKQMWHLRQQCAEGIIDAEALVTELEHLVEEKISKGNVNLSKYEGKVTESLQSSAIMQPKSMTLLSTGEFLFEKTVEPLDFAPSAIEFCKAVENELSICLFDRFKASYSKILQTSASVEGDHDYLLSLFIQSKVELALGQMAMILRFLGSGKEIQKSHLFQKLKEFVDSLPNPGLIINGNSVRAMLTPEAVNDYRNSSAHLDTFTLEKAKNARSWCYRILNALAEAMSPEFRGSRAQR